MGRKKKDKGLSKLHRDGIQSGHWWGIELNHWSGYGLPSNKSWVIRVSSYWSSSNNSRHTPDTGAQNKMRGRLSSSIWTWSHNWNPWPCRWGRNKCKNWWGYSGGSKDWWSARRDGLFNGLISLILHWWANSSSRLCTLYRCSIIRSRSRPSSPCPLLLVATSLYKSLEWPRQ